MDIFCSSFDWERVKRSTKIWRGLFAQPLLCPPVHTALASIQICCSNSAVKQYCFGYLSGIVLWNDDENLSFLWPGVADRPQIFVFVDFISGKKHFVLSSQICLELQLFDLKSIVKLHSDVSKQIQILICCVKLRICTLHVSSGEKKLLLSWVLPNVLQFQLTSAHHDKTDTQRQPEIVKALMP